MINSQKILNKAIKLIPEQTMTLAKIHNGHSWYPSYIEKAYGCKLYDVDGNEYVDYTCSLGTNILGHCYPRINDSIKKQLEKGTLYSLPHIIEVELAELFVNEIDHADMVRFFKNGTDSTSIAVRLSKAYTGNKHIIRYGYHGHQEWSCHNLRDIDVIDEIKNYVHSIDYGDYKMAELLVNKYPIACIIIATTFENINFNFYKKIRELCTNNKIVLIFDEMWSGFRFHIQGIAGYVNVKPDLATYGKSIANGFPLSVIAGREDIMQCFKQIWGYATYGGETLSIRASIETIKEIKEKNVIEYISKLGCYLRKELMKSIVLYNLPIKLTGSDCLLKMHCSKELFLELQKYFIKNNILWNGLFVISYSHTYTDIDHMLETFNSYFN